MNRTERMYAIAEELRRAGAGGVTSARLARMLEVSQRTVKRDLAALAQTGLPLWAQPGPGGGYALAGTASLPPVNFSPAQAVAVAVALGTMPGGGPFGADGAAAMGKLLDAMGPSERERARALAERVWLRSPGPPEEPAVPEVLHALETAVAEHRVVALSHRRASGEVTRRLVEPVLLAWSHGRWYLVAWCRLREAIRWFRVSRIERADLTREVITPRAVTDVGVPPEDAAPAWT